DNFYIISIEIVFFSLIQELYVPDSCFMCWQSMTELKRCCLKVFNSNPLCHGGATNSERILSPLFFI
ncbi:hypothetical protein, partial [Staphylococcus haemolyticus]|uniref:hypothetical protein n=1 Tax=Staphylococcus haemolyticus TaxID=1283 RepID=UPI003703BF0A